MMNPLLVLHLKHKKILKIKTKQMKQRKAYLKQKLGRMTTASKSTGYHDLVLKHYIKLPSNSQYRNGRWTHHELSNLKLAMSIFGDQSWRKIQQFLIHKDKEDRK